MMTCMSDEPSQDGAEDISAKTGDTTATRPIRTALPIWEAYGRVCARLGTDRSADLRNHMAAQIREHGDEGDLADLSAGLKELADRHRAKYEDRAPRGPAVPRRGDADGVQDLPEEIRRMVQVVAKEGPVSAKRVTAALGLDLKAPTVAKVRARLKRLVALEWLTEQVPGRFTVRP
jgi:hypothetical protein